MASMWRRAMVYLGLVDDEEFDDYEDYPEPPPAVERIGERAAEQPEPSTTPAERRGEGPAVRTLPRVREPEHGGRPVSEPGPPTIRPVETTRSRVHVVEPHGFNDAQEVGDRLKAGQPVIINIQGLSRDLQRRLIDFSSGLAYAVGGSMSRVADQVFLLAPENVEVSEEEKERLQARGLYRA
jgi:cell division inhibitor SepF